MSVGVMEACWRCCDIACGSMEGSFFPAKVVLSGHDPALELETI